MAEIPPPRCPIISFSTTARYRLSVPSQIRATDRVLEVGSAAGVTSAHIARYAASVVGIDFNAGEVMRSLARYPDMDFRVMSATNVHAMRTLAAEGAFDVVYVDVSGAASLAMLLPLLGAVDEAIRPRMMVVKSLNLAKLQRSLLAGIQLVGTGAGGAGAAGAAAGGAAAGGAAAGGAAAGGGDGDGDDGGGGGERGGGGGGETKAGGGGGEMGSADPVPPPQMFTIRNRTTKEMAVERLASVVLEHVRAQDIDCRILVAGAAHGASPFEARKPSSAPLARAALCYDVVADPRRLVRVHLVAYAMTVTGGGGGGAGEGGGEGESVGAGPRTFQRLARVLCTQRQSLERARVDCGKVQEALSALHNGSWRHTAAAMGEAVNGDGNGDGSGKGSGKGSGSGNGSGNGNGKEKEAGAGDGVGGAALNGITVVVHDVQVAKGPELRAFEAALPPGPASAGMEGLRVGFQSYRIAPPLCLVDEIPVIIDGSLLSGCSGGGGKGGGSGGVNGGGGSNLEAVVVPEPSESTTTTTTSTTTLVEIGLGKYAAFDTLSELVRASRGWVWEAGVCTAGSGEGAVDALVRVRVRVSPSVGEELEKKRSTATATATATAATTTTGSDVGSPCADVSVNMYAMATDTVPSLRDRAVARLDLDGGGGGTSGEKRTLELVYTPGGG